MYIDARANGHPDLASDGHPDADFPTPGPPGVHPNLAADGYPVDSHIPKAHTDARANRHPELPTHQLGHVIV